jgi:hypothetical protein
MEGIRNYTSDIHPSSGRILLKDVRTIRIQGDYDLSGRQLTQRDLDEALTTEEFIRETVEYIHELRKNRS